jgi:hypothetical protein
MDVSPVSIGTIKLGIVRDGKSFLKGELNKLVHYS